MKKINSSEFIEKKREKLLDYHGYEYNFDESAIATFHVVKESLEQPSEVLQTVPPVNFMQATQLRAWEAIDHIVNCYSAGHSISELRTFFPTALEYWESYARYSLLYNCSPDGRHSRVAHVPLAGNTFTFANKLVCFAILLGWEHLLHRVVRIIEYNNPSSDGMLERLIGVYVAGNVASTRKCTRLPYYKTMKIFDAPQEMQQQLMVEYLSNWYAASRGEPYFETHTQGKLFKGYWAWEAAAITVALNIDDSRYRDADFYPSDMVEFSRKVKQD